MTPADIAAMRADMDAGTDGPWDAGELDEIYSGGEYVLEFHPYEGLSFGAETAEAQEADHRRFARVPAMEAHILALEAEIAELRRQLYLVQP